MTETRHEIARRYIFDMLNSFVDSSKTTILKDFESTPPTVSFYSSDFEKLLRYICEQDSYSVKHPDLELLDFVHSNKYDIDSHCVCPLYGTIYIRINDVAFDQNKIDEFMRCYKKGLVEEEEDKVSKDSNANKFHVRLPK